MATRKKSWKELVSAIRATFRKWKIGIYSIEPEQAPRARNRYHHFGERKVTVRFQLNGRTVELESNGCDVAHDNLERLALTLETLRLSQLRKVEPLVVGAYRQLYPTPAPRAEPTKVDPNDPYAILGVEPRYPLIVIEAIWKARLRVEHPDAGGNAAVATKLNAAMAEIRRRKAA